MHGLSFFASQLWLVEGGAADCGAVSGTEHSHAVTQSALHRLGWVHCVNTEAAAEATRVTWETDRATPSSTCSWYTNGRVEHMERCSTYVRACLGVMVQVLVCVDFSVARVLINWGFRVHSTQPSTLHKSSMWRSRFYFMFSNILLSQIDKKLAPSNTKHAISLSTI